MIPILAEGSFDIEKLLSGQTGVALAAIVALIWHWKFFSPKWERQIENHTKTNELLSRLAENQAKLIAMMEDDMRERIKKLEEKQ